MSRAGPPPTVRAAIDHLNAGRLKQAAEALRQHLRRHPNDDNSQFLLGNILSQDHQNEPAIFALERAAALRPTDPQRWIALGVALLRTRGPAAAELALRSCPAANNPGVLALRAESLAALNRAADAVPLLQQGLSQQPAHVPSLRTLGGILSAAGRTDEAIDRFRSAAADSDIRNLSVYCFHTNYSGTMPPAAVFAAHQRLFNQLKPTATPAPAASHKPANPLRLALLSSDFQQHSVAYFIEPLLDHLDRARFHAICLSANPTSDEVTARLRAKADQWVDASNPDFGAMADAIRAARPDIIIDLGGLTGAARVIALARRIAPIQATYLGYPNTSAVPNVDFRIVDNLTDPVAPYPDGSSSDDLATERLLRIDGCFTCYRPPDDAPPVAARPDGPIAFGSFNTSHKLSPQCIDLWSGLLRRVPGSTLVLKRKEFADPWVANQFIESFARHDIPAAHLRFLGKTPSIPEHLAAYSHVDIALDSFPYHGTTTTCEALLMGVPVVSLTGNSHASRVGLSLLTACGMPHLAAQTPEQFVEIAASLASNRPSLASLRASLRDQVLHSTLCDGPAFAARFGAAIQSLFAQPAP